MCNLLYFNYARRKVVNDPLSQIDKERDAEVDNMISNVTKANSSSHRLSIEGNHQ
jgi:hypothetical protein